MICRFVAVCSCLTISECTFLIDERSENLLLLNSSMKFMFNVHSISSVFYFCSSFSTFLRIVGRIDSLKMSSSHDLAVGIQPCTNVMPLLPQPQAVEKALHRNALSRHSHGMLLTGLVPGSFTMNFALPSTLH